MRIDNDYVDKFSKDLEQWTNNLVAQFTAFDNTEDAFYNVVVPYSLRLQNLRGAIKNNLEYLKELSNWLNKNHSKIKVEKHDANSVKIIYAMPIFNATSKEPLSYEYYEVIVDKNKSFDELYKIMEKDPMYKYDDGYYIGGGVKNISEKLNEKGF